MAVDRKGVARRKLHKLMLKVLQENAIARQNKWFQIFYAIKTAKESPEFFRTCKGMVESRRDT